MCKNICSTNAGYEDDARTPGSHGENTGTVPKELFDKLRDAPITTREDKDCKGNPNVIKTWGFFPFPSFIITMNFYSILSNCSNVQYARSPALSATKYTNKTQSSLLLMQKMLNHVP